MDGWVKTERSGQNQSFQMFLFNISPASFCPVPMTTPSDINKTAALLQVSLRENPVSAAYLTNTNNIP